MEWMLMPLSRYAEFSGRSCRMEYWMYTLFQIIVVIGLAVAFFAIYGLEDNALDNGDAVFGLVFAGVAYLLVFMVPNISVTVRRWHDLGQSGWFFLLFVVLGAIPFVGAIASIANFVWFCLPGNSGPNRYGDDPRGY